MSAQVAGSHSGVFHSSLQHIQNCLDSIQYESAKVGFVTFNHSATFYSVPDDLSQENVKRTVCVDAENPFCVMSEGDLYLSIKEERDKIDFLINHLQQISEAVGLAQNPKKPALPLTLDIVIASAAESMQHSGGKVLLFGVTMPAGGKSALKQSATDDGKKGKNKFESTVAAADPRKSSTSSTRTASSRTGFASTSGGSPRRTSMCRLCPSCRSRQAEPSTTTQSTPTSRTPK